MTEKDLVTRFFELFSSGDLEGLRNAMHPHATWWVSGRIEGLSGTYNVSELLNLLAGVKPAYKEGALRITPTSMIAENDVIAVEAQSFSTLQNGEVYDMEYHFLVKLKDGKIFNVKEYMDTKYAFDTFMT